MIRFSAFLVVVAVGLLAAGGVTSKLLLVYLSIAIGVIALLFLMIGAILHRDELRAPSPAEAPADRLGEVSAGNLDAAPASAVSAASDERDEAPVGRVIGLRGRKSPQKHVNRRGPAGVSRPRGRKRPGPGVNRRRPRGVIGLRGRESLRKNVSQRRPGKQSGRPTAGPTGRRRRDPMRPRWPGPEPRWPAGPATRQ